MKVALRTEGPPRVWQARLAERLAALGHTLVMRTPVGSAAEPIAIRLLLAFERRAYLADSRLFRRLARVPSPSDDDLPDLLIEPLFDGEGGDAPLLKALLRGRAPLVTVRAYANGTWSDLAGGLPAIEEPSILSRSLEQVLTRLVALSLRAIRNFEAGTSPGATSAALPSGVPVSAIRFLVSGLARRIARRLGPARGRSEHWRIAVRHVEGPGVADRKAWPAVRFALLPDDGRRFQADPFAFEYEGRTWLFFEDFSYATRKGTIACAEIDAAGRRMEPRTVLEQPVHLSYPFVFAHDGETYMLPEMSAAGRIQLFRADPFPDRWVADRVLVDGVVAGDATPIRHEGRFWLFATLSGDGGSSWDQLGLFHAPSLFGPWTAHAANPVLVDAGAARPAGAMWHEDGVLMRVAQDCRGGYGVGLAICRVDRLDLDGFAQTIIERLEAPDGFGADGVHSLNRAGAIEVIDLRFPPGRP